MNAYFWMRPIPKQRIDLFREENLAILVIFLWKVLWEKFPRENGFPLYESFMSKNPPPRTDFEVGDFPNLEFKIRFEEELPS